MHLDGDDTVVRQVRPVLDQLILRLESLKDESSIATIVDSFRIAILAINEFEDEIMTEERESILKAIYELAEIVGLKHLGPFVETWRGDW